jgi:hypothetical protein
MAHIHLMLELETFEGSAGSRTWSDEAGLSNASQRLRIRVAALIMACAADAQERLPCVVHIRWGRLRVGADIHFITTTVVKAKSGRHGGQSEEW